MKALLMAKIAWDDVSAQTITNCFIKCGFNKNIQITNEVQNNDGNELWVGLPVRVNEIP